MFDEQDVRPAKTAGYSIYSAGFAPDSKMRLPAPLRGVFRFLHSLPRMA